MNRLDLEDLSSVARRAPGGPRERLSPALTPGQRRRRRRLDLKNGAIRQRSVVPAARAAFAALPKLAS